MTLDSNNVYDLCDEYDGGRKIQAAHEKHVGHVTLEEKLTMAGSTSPCTDVSSSLWNSAGSHDVPHCSLVSPTVVEDPTM